MTLDEKLVIAVDKAVKRFKTTRSAFTRDALWAALERLKARELEKKHREGYGKYPVGSAEFSVWESEQDWGEE